MENTDNGTVEHAHCFMLNTHVTFAGGHVNNMVKHLSVCPKKKCVLSFVFLWAEGVSPSEIHCRIVAQYGKNYEWMEKLKNNCMCSGWTWGIMSQHSHDGGQRCQGWSCCVCEHVSEHSWTTGRCRSKHWQHPHNFLWSLELSENALAPNWHTADRCA